MKESGATLGVTESICPVCLRRIAAERVSEDDAVFLRKSCPEHGDFKTILWRGLSTYKTWEGASRAPARPQVCGTDFDKGCPFDCGLCSDHRQHTCCVVLDVTERCNLACPICFASAEGFTYYFQALARLALAEPDYARVCRALAQAIRAQDRGRLIIVDGLEGGNLAVPSLAKDGLAQSVRGYQPMRLTHWQANWWPG